VERLSDGVKRGTGIAAPMSETGVFPPLTVHMVRVGEETGRLEEMLLKVADALEGELRTELRRVIGLLEPLVILTMGLLVAFIVMAMLLAIFSINDVAL
jgi:general secretion pathway protein F